MQPRVQARRRRLASSNSGTPTAAAPGDHLARHRPLPYDAEDAAFYSLCFSRGGDRLLAGCESGAVVSLDRGASAHLKASGLPPEVAAPNVKVVVVGESGVEVGLAVRLAEERWEPTESTHGMRVGPCNTRTSAALICSAKSGSGTWPGSRNTGSSTSSSSTRRPWPKSSTTVRTRRSPLGIGHWEQALRVAVGGQPPKVLEPAESTVAARPATSEKLAAFCGQHGYDHHTQTSAKTGEGCDELRQTILDLIPWDRLPWTATTRLFKTLQNAVVRLRERGDLALAARGAAPTECGCSTPERHSAKPTAARSFGSWPGRGW